MPNIHPNGGSFTIPHQLHVDEHSFNEELLTTHASTYGDARGRVP